jgi:hypothetical protein
MYPPLSRIEPTIATTCTNCSMMLVQLIVIDQTTKIGSCPRLP